MKIRLPVDPVFDFHWIPQFAEPSDYSKGVRSYMYADTDTYTDIDTYTDSDTPIPRYIDRYFWKWKSKKEKLYIQKGKN